MTRKQPIKIYSEHFSDITSVEPTEKIREGVSQVLSKIAQFIRRKNIDTPASIKLSVETIDKDQRVSAELDGNLPE